VLFLENIFSLSVVFSLGFGGFLKQTKVFCYAKRNLHRQVLRSVEGDGLVALTVSLVFFSSDFFSFFSSRFPFFASLFSFFLVFLVFPFSPSPFLLFLSSSGYIGCAFSQYGENRTEEVERLSLSATDDEGKEEKPDRIELVTKDSSVSMLWETKDDQLGSSRSRKPSFGGKNALAGDVWIERSRSLGRAGMAVRRGV
jgi:hypothetical protein